LSNELAPRIVLVQEPVDDLSERQPDRERGGREE